MKKHLTLLIVASLHCGGCEKNAPQQTSASEGEFFATPKQAHETAKPAPPFEEERILKQAELPELNEAALKSNDPDRAMKMGQAYAASDRPEDHAVLLKYLKDPAFHARLDDAEAYQGW